MSYNELPESNGLQGLDYAQYVLLDFTYHVNPQLDLKLVLERVMDLQAQAPRARINVFLVNFYLM